MVELGRTAPGDAPGRCRVWGWGLPGPASAWSSGPGGEAEGLAGADPSPGDTPVSPPGPELPEGWKESERTAPPTETTAAAAGSLWTFCKHKHKRHSKYYLGLCLCL